MPDGGVGSFFQELVPNSEVQKRPLTIPIADVLDWKQVLDHLRSRGSSFDPAHRYYVVAFRSIRSKGADDPKLYAADALAQAEARQSGGLLMYWYGSLNERRECFAMCIWESVEHARKANSLPAHMVARNLAREMYDTYQLERYWLGSDADSTPVLEPLPSITYRP
ncbi:hypothetical protein R1sor_007582 [Riccia sorocarpa]|uniref:Uncharacterized protein n=1 Tax=Riccia sorocarpa TaxID=122646 RepID=A0ABD3HSL7_9MARC